MQRLADKLTNCEADVRGEFSRISGAVQQRAALRDAGGAEGTARR
jgi:hypothetical protein